MHSDFSLNNFIHVVECICGLAVKCNCISLYQLQHYNIVCLLDYKPLLYKGRWLNVDSYKPILLCTKALFYFIFYLVSLHGD